MIISFQGTHLLCNVRQIHTVYQGLDQLLAFQDAAKQQMTDQEVWEKLQQIVADCIGVKIEKVTPSARFVEDLGAG